MGTLMGPVWAIVSASRYPFPKHDHILSKSNNNDKKYISKISRNVISPHPNNNEKTAGMPTHCKGLRGKYKGG
jgi:hypothetical protein